MEHKGYIRITDENIKQFSLCFKDNNSIDFNKSSVDCVVKFTDTFVNGSIKESALIQYFSYSFSTSDQVYPLSIILL